MLEPGEVVFTGRLLRRLSQITTRTEWGIERMGQAWNCTGMSMYVAKIHEARAACVVHVEDV